MMSIDPTHVIQKVTRVSHEMSRSCHSMCSLYIERGSEGCRRWLEKAPASKENRGDSPFQRQRRLFRYLIWVLLAIGTYNLFVAHFMGSFVPDIEIDKETGQKRVRRRPELQHKTVDGKPVSRYV